jgi:hypothetical protein
MIFLIYSGTHKARYTIQGEPDKIADLKMHCFVFSFSDLPANLFLIH